MNCKDFIKYELIRVNSTTCKTSQDKQDEIRYRKSIKYSYLDKETNDYINFFNLKEVKHFYINNIKEL